MRVIGIDPGYERLGVAVLEKNGGSDELVFSCCVQTDKNLPLPERLSVIGEEFERLIHEYRPEMVGIETLFFNKNQKTAIAVAEARGVVVFLAKRNGLTVKEFGPQEVKVAVTGYGKSDKRAVMEMLPRLVKNLPAKALDDEYDAIAVAVTTLAHHR